MAKPKLRDRPQPSQTIDTDFEEASRDVTTMNSTPAKGVSVVSRSLAVQLQESEFREQLTFAQHHPRNVLRSMEAMVRMATMTEEAAASMHYSVPRGGKMIEGPSIRFAEIVKQAWMHGDSDAFILFINREEKHVVARGIYFDYETANRWKATVQRSIRDKNGQLFSEDMINITCNAACAIAERNAILKGIPRAAWMNAYRAAMNKAAGEMEGLPKKRQEVLRHFMQAGVAPDRVLASVGARAENMLTGAHITSLRGMWSALQNGEATLDELFPPITVPVPAEPTKQRKTLADLGEEAATTPKEDNDMIIAAAREEGMRGFHKGLENPPERFAKDPELSAAWKDGRQQAFEQAEAEQGDEGDEMQA